MDRIKKFKDYFQLGLSITLSCVNVWLSSKPITQTIGVVYKFGGLFYNPALGVIEQDHGSPHLCTMRVSSPFTDYTNNSMAGDIYHNIDPRYICKWSSDSLFRDTLCFEQFDCSPLKMVQDVDLTCSSLFLIGFVLIAILWLFIPTRRKFRIFLWCSSTLILIFSFSLSKISVSYLNNLEVQDILNKIRSIVINKGALDIKYDITVSRYDFDTTLSDIIFDICSGMALGLIANGVKFLKKPKRQQPTFIPLQERFI